MPVSKSEPPAGLVEQYRPSGFFVLRTPLLPTREFVAWGGRDGSVAGTELTSRSRAEESKRLRHDLARRLDAPLVADALRVASPALAENRDGWIDRPPSRRRERMERTLVQYFARMCDRCTPFGLFAGVSLGKIGAETVLRLAPRARYRRRSALDLAQVSALVSSLRNEEALRGAVRYRLNDTLAAVRGGFQYLETHERGGETRHEVAFLEADEALVAVIRGASGEAMTLGQLHAALAAGISDPEVGENDIAEYLDDLIEAQVIEPDVIPAVVGEDPLDQILASLNGVQMPSRTLGALKRLREQLNRLDSYGVGAPSESYAAVSTVWTEELRQKNTDRLLQVDMFKDVDSLCLSDEVVDVALQGAEPLWRLAGPVPDRLRDLKNRFRDRYQSREIPLAEAFDPERGLGVPGPDFRPHSPGSPLLAGLEIGGARGHGTAPDRGTVFAEVLTRRLLDLGGDGPPVLEVDDELLRDLAPAESAALPDALGIHFGLIAESEAAVRRGDFRVLFHATVGPSGARMLGRFCDLDADLLEAVRGHLRDEEALAPDVVYAEIVHSPEGRLGNVVRRPHVREIELSCVGRSRRDYARRLTVDDLLLRLEDGRFRLRSQRDGREVRPRLTSAHNYRRSSGVYRFLAALQSDGAREAFSWNWGSFHKAGFLPRVVRGRAVYALARWRVGRERSDYKAVGNAESPAAREEALARLTEALGLPRFVRLTDGDNRLLLDLHNSLCLTVLGDFVRRRPALILEETLVDDLKGCVSGPEGTYRNEIVLPLVRKTPDPPQEQAMATNHRVRGRSAAQRRFPPGDDWLYFKLYCPPASTDQVLRDVVAQLVECHENCEPGRAWFFIRYSDPETHLRARFSCARRASRRAIEDKATALLAPLVERGLISRVCLDTYVRETERYGGERGMELAETWFRYDSVAVLRLLELVESTGDENLRWKAVAMGFDRLLRDFGLDHAGREQVVGDARDSFGREFHIGAGVRRRLAKRLRAERRGLETLVSGVIEGDARLAAIDQFFRDRSVHTAATVQEFRQLDNDGNLECPLGDVLRSLTHMHANRMFAASARAQELVIHDFLSRTYRSLVVRGKR